LGEPREGVTMRRAKNKTTSGNEEKRVPTDAAFNKLKMRFGKKWGPP